MRDSSSPAPPLNSPIQVVCTISSFQELFCCFFEAPAHHDLFTAPSQKQQPNLWDFCFRFHLASPSLPFLHYGVVSSRYGDLQHFATTILDDVDFNIYSQSSLQHHIAESLLSRSQLVFGDPDLATHSKATGYGIGGTLRSQNPQKGPRVG